MKGSSPKLYWYGAGGSVLAETDTSGNTMNEYIFFGGARIALRGRTEGPLAFRGAGGL